MEKPSWPNTIFGSVLRQLRRSAFLTQEELAFKVGLARTYVSLLERGVKSPTLIVFFRLCVVLEQKPDEVIAEIYRRILQDQGEGRESLFFTDIKDDA